jgi:hypothetical protein
MSEEPELFRPNVPNPYPDGWRRVTDFEYASRLVLAREPRALKMTATRSSSYVVAEPYKVRVKVDGDWRDLVVPKGMLTDLVSVPSFARTFVGRVGPHLEAAIVHDYLYIAWQLIERGARRRDFDYANEVMFAGLRKAKVPFGQRWAIETALTTAGVAWGVYKDPNARLFVKLDPKYRSDDDGLIDDGTGPDGPPSG